MESPRLFPYGQVAVCPDCLEAMGHAVSVEIGKDDLKLLMSALDQTNLSFIAWLNGHLISSHFCAGDPCECGCRKLDVDLAS